MIRLGFWKPDSGPSQMTDEWLQRRNELSREVNQLAIKQRKFKDRQAMLQEMRRRRMKEAKQRRQETKERREKETAGKSSRVGGEKKERHHLSRRRSVGRSIERRKVRSGEARKIWPAGHTQHRTVGSEV